MNPDPYKYPPNISAIYRQTMLAECKELQLAFWFTQQHLRWTICLSAEGRELLHDKWKPRVWHNFYRSIISSPLALRYHTRDMDKFPVIVLPYVPIPEERGILWVSNPDWIHAPFEMAIVQFEDGSVYWMELPLR